MHAVSLASSNGTCVRYDSFCELSCSAAAPARAPCAKSSQRSNRAAASTTTIGVALRRTERQPYTLIGNEAIFWTEVAQN